MVYCTNGPYKKDSTMHIDTLRHKATYFDPRETSSKESTINPTKGISTADYKKLNSFILYPNPTNGMLYIGNSTPESFNFILENLSGTQLLDKEFYLGDKNEIDLSLLAPGFYIVKVISLNYSVINKIVKN